MDKEEVILYKNQIKEIEIALEADPENEGLVKLKNEIQDLLELSCLLESKDSNNSQTNVNYNVAATDSSYKTNSELTNSVNWKIGDDCYSKYSEDGKYYAAKIVDALPGNRFKVTFVGYGNSESVSSSLLHPITISQQQLDRLNNAKSTTLSKSTNPPSKSSASPSANTEPAKNTNKRRFGRDESPSSDLSAPKAGKPGKNLKGPNLGSTASVEQKAWQDFTKKKSKRFKVAPVNKNSIFKSPETIDGRVGVIGSGRGMTQYTERVKHR
ncbi:Survival of motor neuron-related-splicing factor 30 [Zancudomyces culisetae]|uniref:Survival of motor neuron-related-splicing factor 30 n=1 Tax=Zancudomyces culisetae TaxID=1213189 RepID=A0A1R1PZA2_ZANCU|nr:Survival of motor neuron-related-splicing factor 30 [Zancudomyces culisetae]|eukprot:OMH86292.1 Survival of motor neuron-related-splicing factor 30 [Zancudomyces culisetae]